MAVNITTEQDVATASADAQLTRIPLPRMDGFDRDRFDRACNEPRKPMIFAGAVSSWPAVARWTPQYFATKYKDLSITPSVGLPDTQVPYVFKDVDFRQSMTVSEFAERMNSGDRCYIDQTNIDIFEGLDADFSFVEFGPPDIHLLALWMGSRTRSGLHYDFVDNFFAQVYGSKRVIMAAPEEARNLYRFPDNYSKSQIAPETPDLKAYPRLKKATFLEGLLEPGDLLFIPKGWWHYLVSSEQSISLSCWYGVPLPLTDGAKATLQGGPRVWGQFVRDFFWHGVLHQGTRRLYSPPSTGKMFYDLCASLLPGRRPPAQN